MLSRFLTVLIPLVTSLTIGLSGCAEFPALDIVVADPSAPYPALIPLSPLLAQAADGVPHGAARNPGLGSRIDQLNARANQLRGPLIDTDTRMRMQAGVDITTLQ